MQAELKILYIWLSSLYSTPENLNSAAASRWVTLQPKSFSASVIVVNGLIVKCRYTTRYLDGERWTSPEDYIKKYNLSQCTPVIERIEIFQMQMKYFRLTIVADTNDADYIREDSKVSEEELEEVIMPVLRVLRKEHHNFFEMWYSQPVEATPFDMYEGKLTREQINYFREYCPSIEGGFHTITKVTISPWQPSKTLFKLQPS